MPMEGADEDAPRRVPRSLQVRLLLSFAGLGALAIVLTGVAISERAVGLLNTQYVAAYRANGQAVAAIMNDEFQHAVQGSRFSIKARELGVLIENMAQQSRARVRLYDLRRHLIVDSGNVVAPPGSHLTPDTFGAQVFTAGIIPLGKTQLAPFGRIEISHPLTDRAYQQSQFLTAVAWIALGILLLTIVVGGILSDRLLAPLRVLTRTTARVGAGTLGLRVPAGRRDEVGELAHQFNLMAKRLEESFGLLSTERDRLALDRDHLRQFVADVSHELRTPLTALQTFNDLLRDGREGDAATRHEFLDESAQQIERLHWLTRNLLDLSRLEAGITRIEPQPADLGDTVRRAVGSVSPVAIAKGLTLIVDAPPVVLAHDSPRLEQAIGNIINNAVKFSPPGSTVSIQLRVHETRAVVEVRDEGPGIPPAEQAHVFERFYRGRAANRGGEGSGLGLAITKAIADAHDATIDIQPAADQGTIVRLSLPRRVPVPIARRV